MQNIQEVFKTQGQPTVTYVRRDGGRYERELSQGIDSRGSLCLVTGPSKTGKTTLYHAVAQIKKLEVLQVRCQSGLTASEFWKHALEKVRFERISSSQYTVQRQRTVGGEVSGKTGWAWLAEVVGKLSANVSASTSDSEIKALILAEASPDHLIPVLKTLPFLLVVEDLHYLAPDVKKVIFQQWKTFVDQEVSVVVVSTTHHAADLAYANPDLSGRITQITLGNWALADLQEIVYAGFRHLGIEGMSPSLAETIAQESAGLPLVTQAVCQQILIDKQRDEHELPRTVSFGRQDVFDAMHQVAMRKFGSFAHMYNRLAEGPRRGKRKHNAYELVLSTFTLDPLKFSLRRSEITERLAQLRTIAIAPLQIPPAAVVNVTLKTLAKLQADLEMTLLEWSDSDRTLFIVEPTFLFFLRWRQRRKAAPSLRDVLSEMFGQLPGESELAS